MNEESIRPSPQDLLRPPQIGTGDRRTVFTGGGGGGQENGGNALYPIPSSPSPISGGSSSSTGIAKPKGGGVKTSSNGYTKLAVSSDEYILAGGVSMLDGSTKLRIMEAELNIVRRDFSELLAERNTLETQCRRYEDSWRFTVQQLARAIEQRNDAVSQLQILEGGGSPVMKASRSPEFKMKKMKSQQLRVELDSIMQQLNTQMRVSRQLEFERDKANDECDLTKAQLQTVILQNQDLINACAEVARQRDRAIAEKEVLREELNRYDNELECIVDFEGDNEAPSSTREKLLLQQIKMLREQREQLQTTYHQTIEQYKKQVSKLTLDKRNAAASADGMRALLQRRLEGSQTENTELRAELRTSSELITQLKNQLAHLRLSQQGQSSYLSTGSMTTSGDGNSTSPDSPPESQSSELQVLSFKPGSAGLRSTLSQDTGTILYNEGSVGSSSSTNTPSLTQHSDLISPGGSSLSGYRVSSARTRRNHYVPTASPFPEETHNHSSEEESSSWI
ncbi:PREDICTED: non-neuronal cytoplasmic intermediate filament protein-like [Amphimedon queenslandica]|uniref:Uncharacterized protein n=1 Tax=Amphimedon queenslandica TaxID=400682 RepID=A0A1X7UAN5_AMPQE|nr:PREDICTED: non-neuronal cytoplasmic intermediate filament protein-like [Amphimedon queenslandica]|eukprot:XP_011405674.2 PREDICTED: non-neuronal cytoplasmic intermediate filament protein-like [Amphimedon queenslandica]